MSTNPVAHPVINEIAERWSPYRFEPRAVEDEKILTCLEAARWAASSFNDQPWAWIIAQRQDTNAFQAMVGCLMEANQGWASNAGVLMISVMRPTFRRNQKPNRVALHDLGAAAAHMALQAAALGLQAHQMGGINLSQARHVFGIDDDHEPQTAIAIGYPDTSPPTGDEAKALEDRQSGPRKRRAFSEFTFAGKWGQTAAIVE
ncbi:nitroreductase family protein [Neorhodopirellula lusitana]|uniref:nitroreductase family protein n=1 Tax=Neorhodopirellula lusitana TaxID=445327 RepID=UPI00384E8C18